MGYCVTHTLTWDKPQPWESAAWKTLVDFTGFEVAEAIVATGRTGIVRFLEAMDAQFTELLEIDTNSAKTVDCYKYHETYEEVKLFSNKIEGVKFNLHTIGEDGRVWDRVYMDGKLVSETYLGELDEL